MNTPIPTTPQEIQDAFVLSFIHWLEKNFRKGATSEGNYIYIPIKEEMQGDNCFLIEDCLRQYRQQQIPSTPEMPLLSSAYTTILEYAGKAEVLKSALELIFKMVSADMTKEEITSFIAQMLVQLSNP